MICKHCSLLVLPEEGDESKAPAAIICAGHLPTPTFTVTIPAGCYLGGPGELGERIREELARPVYDKPPKPDKP